MNVTIVANFLLVLRNQPRNPTTNKVRHAANSVAVRKFWLCVISVGIATVIYKHGVHLSDVVCKLLLFDIVVRGLNIGGKNAG